MGGPPSAYTHDVLRSPEVVSIDCLGEPALLAGGFARAPAGGLGAIALVSEVAHIRPEQFLTVPTLTPSSLGHR